MCIARGEDSTRDRKDIPRKCIRERTIKNEKNVKSWTNQMESADHSVRQQSTNYFSTDFQFFVKVPQQLFNEWPSGIGSTRVLKFRIKLSANCAISN